MAIKNLISKLSANTRKILAKSRALAMNGQLEVAIKNIDEGKAHIINNSSTLSETALATEIVSLSLLKAELLHLNLDSEEAFSVLRAEVMTKLNVLPNEVALAINQNQTEIQISIFQPSDKNLHKFYDERELIGMKFWNPEDVVYAYEYAARGEHYDALPTFQQELESAYKSGSWQTFRQAARRMGLELIQLGFVPDAVYQTTIAQDPKLIESIGQSLFNTRNIEIITLSIKKILKTANLKAHTFIASKFLKVIADLIPDDQFDEVFQWLFSRAKLVPSNWREEALSFSIWETLFELHRRLSKEQGKLIIDVAVNHPAWEGKYRLREILLKNVNAAVPHLTEEELINLAHKSLPSATTEQDQSDYPEALNLVCHIAERSEEAKELIGNNLFASDPFQSFELGQIAQFFNREMVPEDVERIAFEMASDIRKQVQFYSEEEEISRPVSILSTISIPGLIGAPVIHMYGFDPLDSLLAHRKHMSESAVEAIVNAILDMIVEPENIPANKTGLLRSLVILADKLTPKIADIIFEKLQYIIEGRDFEIPSILQKFGDHKNPLNPFKINVQDLEDIQANALFALVIIEEHNPGIYGNKLKSLLEQGMVSPIPIIRKYSFASMRKINVLGDSIVTNLFIATQDPNSKVAAHAFLALARNENINFSEADWFSLCHLLTLALNSNNSVIRRDAAYVIVKRQSEWEKTSVAERMMELKNAFANDLCYSVRATATHND